MNWFEYYGVRLETTEGCQEELSDEVNFNPKLEA